jgi:hypothetical protein
LDASRQHALQLVKLDELGARQELTSATREVAAIVARDFFPGESRKQMEGALAEAETAINARFSPDEPSAAKRKLSHRDVKKTIATARGPHESTFGLIASPVRG